MRQHVLAQMSSFLINASVSIQVSQPYSNSEIHVTLNRRILRLSLTLGDLNIDISLANAAHASSIRTLKSRSDIQHRIRGTWSSTLLICYDKRNGREIWRLVQPHLLGLINFCVKNNFFSFMFFCVLFGKANFVWFFCNRFNFLKFCFV